MSATARKVQVGPGEANLHPVTRIFVRGLRPTVEGRMLTIEATNLIVEELTSRAIAGEQLDRPLGELFTGVKHVAGEQDSPVRKQLYDIINRLGARLKEHRLAPQRQTQIKAFLGGSPSVVPPTSSKVPPEGTFKPWAFASI